MSENNTNISNIELKQKTMKICCDCNNNMSLDNKACILPNCNHIICRKCLEVTFNNSKKLTCPTCNEINELDRSKIEDYYEQDSDIDIQEDNEDSDDNNQESNNESSLLEGLCEKHDSKLIEYFCEECLKVVCVVCIFQSHNGHKLCTLSEKCNIIKHNIRDFKKVVDNLRSANNENRNVVKDRYNEIITLKKAQEKIVNDIFDNIVSIVEDKRSQFLNEFNNKFLLEAKRFKKLDNTINNIHYELDTIVKINSELCNFAETKNEASTLKKINDFTTFLQRSLIDLTRLYKTEMSLKTELKMDPAVNPININVKNLLLIIEKIDPKIICYSTESYYNPEFNLKGNEHMKYMSDLEESSNLIANNPNNKIEYDNIYEGLKNVKNNIAALDKSISKSDSNSDLFNKRKYKLVPNIPKPLNSNKIPTSIDHYTKHDIKILDKKYDLSSINNSINYNTVKPIRLTEKNNSFRSSNNSRNNQYRNNIYNNSNNASKYSLPMLNSFDKQKKNNINNKPNSFLQNSNSFSLSKKREFIPSLVIISDTSFVLKLNLELDKWVFERLDNISTFNGGLKYSCATCIGKERIIVSGGCSIDNSNPTNKVFEINTSYINKNVKLKPMSHKRWAHCSLYIEPYIYYIGGYDHKDVENANQNTLKYCEKYNIETGIYEGIANLSQARAFSGCTIVNQSNVFIFGGLYNNTFIPTIEKYDIFANIWSIYHVKLFDAVSKIGVINYKNNIILLGGVNEKFEPVEKAVVLELNTGKFKKMPDMLSARTFNQNSCFIYNNYIYAIGGNYESSCEKFSLINNKWSVINSYSKVLSNRNKQNELYTYSFSLNFVNTQN